MAPPATAADHALMQEIMRLVDSDEQSLAARVEVALALLGGEPVVSRFTLWYTTRPPVHHAVLLSPARSGR
jgi:hypothetical protein